MGLDAFVHDLPRHRRAADLALPPDRRPARPAGTVPSGPARAAAQGVAFALVGLALLFAPSAMVDAWPWPISAGLAQFYGGPFLAYAVCSWHYAGKPAWADLAAIVPAMLVFTAGTIVVSLQHSELFSSSDLAAWVWFGGFGAPALVLLVMSARALQAVAAPGRRDSTEPA